jgi:hypothetical protein
VPAVEYSPPGYHQHDGFYLRLQGGGGYLTTSEKVLGSTATVSGGAGAFSVSIGAAVIRDLIIYGEILGMVVSDPHVSYESQSGTASGVTMDCFGFGPGVTYYFEPINMYLSASVLFSQVSASSSKSNAVAETNMGFGFSLDIGKEWWVSTNWGLGPAFKFQFASMKEKGGGPQMTALGFALLFSATYN